MKWALLTLHNTKHAYVEGCCSTGLLLVEDPGERCAKWTFEGSPAGLEKDTSDIDGLFQQVEPDDAGLQPGQSLVTDYDNYSVVEEDEEAFATLEGYQHKGFLTKVDTLDEADNWSTGSRSYRSWAA